MLKFIFWSLLAANAALLVVHYGNFDQSPAASTAVHVPKPLNADKLTVIPASQANQPAPDSPAPEEEAAAPAPVSAPVPAPVAKPVACTELGPFAPDDAKRFEASLQKLALGERLSRRNVQEVASHMVFIPSQGSKEGADKKAGELQRLGVKDFYVIQDSSAMRWGISLGVFKTEQAAKNHLANLNKLGVHSAQSGGRSVTSNKLLYQLRKLDEKTMQSLEKVTADFPGQELHDCK